jgi:hypothetical protein
MSCLLATVGSCSHGGESVTGDAACGRWPTGLRFVSRNRFGAFRGAGVSSEALSQPLGAGEAHRLSGRLSGCSGGGTAKSELLRRKVPWQRIVAVYSRDQGELLLEGESRRAFESVRWLASASVRDASGPGIRAWRTQGTRSPRGSRQRFGSVRSLLGDLNEAVILCRSVRRMTSIG